MMVKRIHIVGRKNHGKTTLVVDLIQAMRKAGCRVGSIKHTHHGHELDTPGKDSHRHRTAGADVVGICSPSLNALFWVPGNDGSGSQSKYVAVRSCFRSMRCGARGGRLSGGRIQARGVASGLGDGTNGLGRRIDCRPCHRRSAARTIEHPGLVTQRRGQRCPPVEGGIMADSRELTLVGCRIGARLTQVGVSDRCWCELDAGLQPRFDLGEDAGSALV